MIEMKRIFLLGIILLAVILRFWQLQDVPPSMTWDEVAWGYNAYSLGIDGRDEFGKFLPLTYLESFGDFKPPLYAYLSVIPVKLFGLNEFSTRFASAFFGSLAIIVVYYLTIEILKKNPFTNVKSSSTIALLTSAILAISPWHIMLSRAAFEANVASFFIILGVFAFLRSRSNIGWLFLSVISFVLSMYTFNTARIVSPILVVILFIVLRKHIFQNMLKSFFASLIGALIFLPLFFFLLTPQASLRYHEVNIFSDTSLVERANQMINNDNNAVWSKMIHNRRFVYTLEYLKHYFDNLSPQFLFIKGDGNPKFSIQDVGQLYIWEIPFIIVGILFLIRKKEGMWFLVPILILVGIIPAGIARETPHALRIESVLPAFQILSAYGLYYFVLKIKKKYFNVPLRALTVMALAFVIFGSLVYFIHNYLRHYSNEYSREWQYGYKEAIKYVEKEGGNYDKVYFTESLGRPYIYALFYGKVSPLEFRKSALIDREVLGFVHVRSFGKYKFMDTFPLNPGDNALYIDQTDNIPGGVHVLSEIKLLNGNSVLSVYTL